MRPSAKMWPPGQNLVFRVFVLLTCFANCVLCDKAESSDQKEIDLFKQIVLPPNISPVQRKSVVVTDTRESLSKEHSETVQDILVAGSQAAPSQAVHGQAVPKSAKYQRWRPPFSRDSLQPGMFDTDNERFAPPTHRTGPGETPYIITEARLKTIRSRFLYWFFDQGGDDADGIGDYQKDIHVSSPQIHKNFNFQLPFFGFRFNYTRVSMHGYLEFSDPPEHYTYPLSFPNQDWPKKNDPSFIGMFYSKCRIGSIRPSDVDQRAPGVYFRMERDLMTRTDQMGVEMRERLMWDIREGVVGADTFIPKHSVIITWKNMSFAGGIDNSLYRTNTFQMVLATDEVFTYAIFNYADLQWTSHTEAGGDTTGGEGGTPAFIGFNAGNGTRSAEYKPYSQTSAIRDLSGRGWANGFPGRHIFRIDENIILGTCNKDIAGANLQLTFAPESGNMLGGTVVNITGPCFLPGMKIRCKFDTEDVVGTVVDTNRAICIQPFVMAEGYVLFSIAIGEGAYNWKGKYFIETPATATERITFESEAVHERYPNEIKISWNKYNLTSNLAAPVRISLWGYRETTILPELVYIDMIEEGIANTGSYSILPANFKSRNNYLTNDVRFGFIHINLTNPTQYQGLTITPVLWSRPIPLGWYFAPQWERLYGSSWQSQLCDLWLMNDRYLKNFAADIAQCPCTLSHALADKGRFMPDFDCDIDRNPSCRYNKGARHCVKTGSPSLEGSEQQCCYDKNNYLMLSYDQQWGSRPRRSHNMGYLPWNEANKVPTLSQWYHDMSPFYFCCLWQEEQAVGCETFRFERRPSQDCVAYQSPYVATVFGDPHVITFDDLEYTFNGKGEFVLVHADTSKLKLDIQARFEQIPDNIYGEVRATQLTAVVARDNSSAIIEVRLRPPYAQWRYRLDVFADGRRVFFDRPSFRTQHFPRVTVYQPSYILNQSQIIVMFESGVGVEVVENKGYMTTRVYMPWKFMNQTRGLLGNWSFDPTDDMTNPDGTMTTVTYINNFERVHKDFALNWLLEDREDAAKGPSLFLREYRRTASYYANRTFEPEWRKTPEEIIPANRSQDVAMANAFCGDSYQCKYDYAMSLNRDMAFYTLLYQDTFSTIKSVAKQRVITCGILETPRFGRKSNFFFVPGTKVTFECNQDFVLIGDQRRTCTPEGIWDVPVYGYTECLRYVEYDFRQIFFATMVVVAVVLPLLIVLLCIIAFIVRKVRGEGSSASWRYVAETGRRLSLARHETVPLKSASNLIDADSGIGLTNKGNNDSSPESNLHSVKDEPDWKYDGVYHTNEPLPGRPLTEFDNNKIWDFKDEDVFSSRANVSADPPSPDVVPALPPRKSSNPKRNSGILKKPQPLDSQGTSSADTQSPATSSQFTNSPAPVSPAPSSPLPVSPAPSSPAVFSDESSPQSSPQSPVSKDVPVHSQSNKKQQKPVRIKVPSNGSSIVTQI